MNKILLSFTTLIICTVFIHAQWTEQSSGVTTLLYSVSGVDNDLAWVGGASGRVLRTTNGGTTWSSVGGGAIGTAAVYNIFGLDANTALCTTSPSATYVYRTTNGGTTWTQVFTQAGGFINVIWMTSPTNGYMEGDPVGGRWSLWKTSNGGASWDSTGMYNAQNGGEAGWNNSMYVTGSTIFYGTNSNRLYISTNGGSTWTSQTTPAANQYAVWFNNSNNGMAGGSGMYITTNGGTAWTNLTAPGSGNVSGITGVGNDWWFIRQASSIYRSTNNGTSWTTEYTAPAGSFTHIAKARNGNRLWAVRSNGGISKSDGIQGISPISGEIPSIYSLNQNYPNPFNPVTNIEFALPKSSYVELKVYNSLGVEVATVYSGFLTAGNYKSDFYASELSSGVYFYQIKAADFTDTKKMILVK